MAYSRTSIHPAPSEKRMVRRRLNLERLEPRLLLAADTDPNRGLLTHGGICSCPICSGVGLEQYQPEAAEVVGGSPSGPVGAGIAGLPLLSSLPGAAATIFLDFDGHTEASWGSYTNVVTRVYDRDGNASSFSAAEISAIQEIWARVAEDFAPFNINVTTVEPPSFANRVAIRVAIGGNYSDWFGSAAGGVAYVGGFYNSSSNVAYVFEDALGNGNPKYVAEAASHEAGHTFGLLHQAVWNGSVKTEEYNPGNSEWAPIMGVGYYSNRTTWHQGPTSNSPSQIQDDLAVLSNASNAFGYRADDYGSSIATAEALASGSVNVAGLIGTGSDWDVFQFTTDGGSLNLSLNVAQFGANLDSVLDLLNSAGQTILSSSPAGSLGASLATTLAAGTYYVAIHSSGGYGNLGTYTLTGTLPGGAGPTPTPEIDLDISGAAVADGGTVSFGSTTVGTAVTRTITVRNSGTGTLSLTAINAASLPAGFSLVSNLGSTSLGAGQSTTFSVRLTAAAAGTFGGTLSIANSDSDESPYDLQFTGTVAAAQPQPIVRYLDNGASGFATSGTWYRVTGTGRESDIHRTFNGNGSTYATWTFTGLTAGQYRVSVTHPGASYFASNAPFTVLNGSQALGTVSVNQRAASTGFADAGSQWRDLGNFTITGNTLTVRLTNAANGWVVADAIRIESVGVDGGESEPEAPEIDVDVGGANVTDGGTISFGTTTVGAAVNRTITIRNTGDAALTLGAINAASLPAGFSLVSNITATTLNPGQSTSFTVRLDATAAGSFGGAISFTNNDSDESPFDLQLTGSVSASQPQPFSQIIDDGAAGHTKTGTWYSASSGRDRDSQWTLNGTGSSVSTWTFSGISSGQYRISATWPAASHYASDAPYSVYNGTQFLGTSRVSQKVAPSGLSDSGSQWKDLGNFTITGNTLVVKLANNANGWVVADAIRIEKIADNVRVARSEVIGSGSANLAGLLPLSQPGTTTQQQATDSVFQDRANDSWLQATSAARGQTPFWQVAGSRRADAEPELAALEQANELLNDLAAHFNRPGQDLLSRLWD